MKKNLKLILSIFLAGTVFLPACEQKESIAEETASGIQPIRFTTGSGTLDYEIMTKSDISTMRELGFGVFGYNTGDSDFDSSSPQAPEINNYKLTSEDGVEWTYTDRVAFWNTASDDKYTFLAYHPYRNGQTEELSVPTSSTTIGGCIDYLVAEPVKDQTTKDGVRLKFGHIFSRLGVNMKLGSSFAGQSYTLKGIRFNGIMEYPVFSLAENDFDRTSAIPHDIEATGADITGTLAALTDVITVKPLYISPYDYATKGESITISFDFEYIFNGGDVPVRNTFTKEISITKDMLRNHAYDINVTFTPDKEGGIRISVSHEDYVLTEGISCDILQTPPPPVSLSADGTSNCYIVPEAGNYSFDATYRGNSTSEPVGEIATAEVIWESAFDAVSAGDLITGVKVEGSMISFSATEKKGNALIAAKDAGGTILWSWHIWMTDMPEDQTYKNGAGTVMDRNLGATSASKTDGQKTYGLYYQWGRKDPFVGRDASLSIKSTVFPELGKNSLKQSSAWANQNPNTFVRYNGEWISTIDDYRWNSADGGKTINDPCPNGYRVPGGGTADIWAAAAGKTGYIDSGLPEFDGGFDFGSGNGSEMQFTDDSSCWYPAAGCIDYGGLMYSPTQYGHYLTNIHNISGSQNSFILDFHCFVNSLGETIVEMEISSRNACARGQSVRCIKE